LVAKKMVPRGAASGLRQFWESAHPADHITRQNSAADPRVAPVDSYVASLQACRYQLPISKADKLLGYRPKTTFAEGSARTAKWLQFSLGLHTETDKAGHAPDPAYRAV